MSNYKIIEDALAFEKKRVNLSSRDERIKAALKAKEYVLALNTIYKETKEAHIMDIMKRLTQIKRKMERRLKAPITI